MIFKNHRIVKFIGRPIWLFVLMAGLVMAGTIATQAAYADSSNVQTSPPIKVATKEIEPFVIIAGDRLSGFSIELWEEIAREAGLEFEYVEVVGVQDQLDAVLDGEVDLAIAAISITSEREDILDFSHPYFNSGLQIMTTPETVQLLPGLLRAVLDTEVIGLISGLLITMLLISHVVWLFERKNNPDFPQGYRKGIWQSFWWAAATVTTVGYGDTVPLSKWGRALGIIWMFAGLFVLANFTAALTAQVTLTTQATINSVIDLPGKAVVTLEGSTASDFLREQSIAHKQVETIEEAYEMLEGGDVDAVVYDAPILQHYAYGNGQGKVILTGPVFEPENYGIALPHDSPYREIINNAYLDVFEDGTYEELRLKYFGERQ